MSQRSIAQIQAGLKGAAANREKKLNSYVNIGVTRGGFLDITHRELESYRKIHTKCEMCGTEPLTKRNGMCKNLVIDHDHKTGKFRGLLCITCNRFLGYYENSSVIAEKYLTSRS